MLIYLTKFIYIYSEKDFLKVKNFYASTSAYSLAQRANYLAAEYRVMNDLLFAP